MANNITYVFEDTEVKLTGRKATKPSSSIVSSDVKRLPVIHDLHEITPVDEFNDWKKWVRMNQLYEIVNEQ